MKYIVYEDSGQEFMITFPSQKGQLEHKAMADRLGLINIVAAGFFLEVAGRKKFTGESMTLDIASRGDIDRDLYVEQGKR